MRILIVGAGGHAQVVADALQCASKAGSIGQPIGYLDDNPTITGELRLGLPVLGTIDRVSAIEHDALVIAIGNNHIRSKLYKQFQQQGESFATVCHPRATIAHNVTLGPGVVIFAGVIVNTGSRIGANTILNTACTIDHHNWIGDHVHIGPGVHLGGDVQIGTGTLVGIGATVMPQRQVGTWSTVGAAALVYYDVPDQVTVIGMPAQISNHYNPKRLSTQ